jgi:hypothetical protein
VALDAGECNPGASGDTARRVIFDDIIRIGGGGGGFGDCPGVGAGGTAGEFEGEAGGAGMDGNGGAGGAVGLDGGGGGGAGLFGGGGGGSSSSGGGGGGGGSSFGPVGSEFSVAGPTPEVVISYTEQPPPEPPVITSTSPLPGGVVGVPYSQTLQAEPADEDDVLAWSTIAGALPGGLTLSTGGVISGTPTTAGMFSFTVTVQNEENAPDSVERGESGPLGDADADADDSATMTFSLTVTSAPPTPSVPQAPVGPVQTGGGTPAGTSPWLPYGGAAAGIGKLLTLGGLARRRYNTGT